MGIQEKGRKRMRPKNEERENMKSKHKGVLPEAAKRSPAEVIEG